MFSHATGSILMDGDNDHKGMPSIEWNQDFVGKFYIMYGLGSRYWVHIVVNAGSFFCTRAL